MRITLDLVLSMLILVLGAGCGGRAPTAATIVPTPSVLVTPMLTGSALREVCPKTGTDLSGHILSHQALLLLDVDNKELFTLDLKTGTRAQFLPSTERLISYAVSPDGRLVAYQAEDAVVHEQRLIVVGANGVRKASISWEANWDRLAYWLDATRLIVRLRSTAQPAYLIVDPLSQERTQLTPQLSDMYVLEFAPDWMGAGIVIYDPTLRRAVVAGINNQYVLWDTIKAQRLGALQAMPFVQFPTRAPQWSSDGARAIVSAPAGSTDYLNDELFSIARNGEVRRVTHVDSAFPRVSIDRYAWAPDNSRIAMLLWTGPSGNSEERLGMLDFSTGQLDLFCIQGNSVAELHRSPQGDYDNLAYRGVVWSPDASKVVLATHLAANTAGVVLVDILHAETYVVAQNWNVLPVGWLAAQP